jgi:ATP-binding cassette subfamily B protein
MTASALRGLRDDPRRSPVWELARRLPGASPRLAACVGALIAVEALVPTGRAIASGVLVGSLSGVLAEGFDSPAGRRFDLALGGLALSFVLQMSLPPWRSAASDALARRFMGATFERIMRATLSPPTVAHLEDPATFDQISRARNEHWVGPRSAANGLIQEAATRLRGAGALVLLAAFDWRLALLLLAVHQWRNHRLAAVHRQILPVMWGKTEAFRRSGYLRGLATGGGAAKEVRVFGLGDWALDRFRDAWLAAMGPIWHERRDAGMTVLLSNVPAILAMGLTVGLLARAGLAGEIDVGAVVTYVGGAFIVFNSLGWEPFEAGRLEYGAAGLRPLAELEAEMRQPRRQLGGSRPADGLPRKEIRLEGVHFHYPGKETAVLRGLDLAIPVGRSLAVVGSNGCGKTTLIKLLARLYDPTGGRILVDGVDLREIAPRQWQRRVAPIFQEFLRHPFSAADNVAFGAPERRHDREALAAAARSAGALELVEGLPKGWDTILSRQFTGGVALSGGEWQRIALARALFASAAGAGVLVLDEPTAHLDVRAEAAFYDNFLDLTHGLTTILISHRFSTVRRADRIVVIEDGVVAEQGSHDELLALGGRYASMFGLQAARFVEGHGSG